MFRTGETAEVVIVGGGVIGLSVARALARRGVRQIVLIERAGLGSEASSAAAGMLAPQAEADCADDFFSLACASRDLYPEFAAALHQETGIDIELDHTGTIYLALTEQDEVAIGERYGWQTRAGLAVEQLTASDAHLLEPCVSEAVRGALRFPLDGQVENRRLVSALAEANRQRDVRLVTGVTVESLSIEQGRVTGVQTSTGFISTRNLVLAAGAWTSQLHHAQRGLPQVRIEPVRGQMICLEANPQVAQHVIYSPRGYLVPRLDGRLLAGATTEQVGFDKRITAAGVHALLTSALEIAPQVLNLPVTDIWAGLRPCAPDKLPLLGACDEVEGLVYATGHYRNGILLAPITGELIADVIVDTVMPSLIRPFSPNRFALVRA
jgi:glycine oxidase